MDSLNFDKNSDSSFFNVFGFGDISTSAKKNPQGRILSIFKKSYGHCFSSILTILNRIWILLYLRITGIPNAILYEDRHPSWLSSHIPTFQVPKYFLNFQIWNLDVQATTPDSQQHCTPPTPTIKFFKDSIWKFKFSHFPLLWAIEVKNGKFWMFKLNL